MISVIIPVYNVASFLEECIYSVLQQTYAELEIILIDDGSTDGSQIICDNFARKDSRIQVIHQKNIGLSGARNTGINLARGEYLIFVDADDCLHPMMIQILFHGIMYFSAEIAICSYQRIAEQGASDIKNIFVGHEFAHVEILSGRECLIKMYNDAKPDMVVAWNKLYRRQDFDKLRYPEGKVHEDMFLTYQILYSLKRCIYIPVALYKYRIRQNSITSKRSICELEDMVQAYYEQCEFYKNHYEEDLYFFALQRYESCIADMILFLRDEAGGKELEDEYSERFRSVYIERIRSSKMKIKHKMKFRLFMINKNAYQRLKAWREKNVPQL